MATRGKDAAAILATTGTTALTAAGLMATGGAAAGLPAAVAALLGVAAGSAAVPVIGWVIAGLAGATAGTIALSAAIRRGKLSKADAIAQAQGLGLEDAQDIPGFIIRAMKKGKSWRAEETQRLIEKIAKNPDKANKARRKDVQRLQILLITDAQQTASDEGRAPPPAPIAALEREYGIESDNTTYVIAAIAAAAAAYYCFWS